MSEENQGAPRGLYERLKTNDDGWELWAKMGVTLLAMQIVAFIIAYLRLGEVSIWTHAVVIPLLGVLTLPMTFWGLMRSIFRPPVFRWSRTVAFICLVVVGLTGNQPILSAPVSTGDWTSEHEYHLPFDGQWATLAGGEDRSRNYHLTTAAHRWGYDFVPVVDGERYVGNGSRLEDHHCYGTPVLAPVAGTVIQSVGSEPDQQPGHYESNQILGNHVVIKVGEGEYLFMAHFRQGSLAARAGDVVEAGQQIAECGNSGRSYTPHLHMHLQNSRAFPIAEGLPLRFHHYLADGEAVEVGMPLGSRDFESELGQIVENQRPWPQQESSRDVDGGGAEQSGEVLEEM